MGFINNEKHVKKMLFRFVTFSVSVSASDSAYFDVEVFFFNSKSTECDK